MRPYGLSWASSEKVSPMSTMYEPAGNVISPVLPADFTAVSAEDVPAGMSSPLAVPPTDNASTMARTTIIVRRNLYPPGGFSVFCHSHQCFLPRTESDFTPEL